MMKIKSLTLALMATALFGCGANEQNASKTNTADDTKPATEEVVRIATESSFKPFSYLDNQGNLMGFEIDLANALCGQMQVTCDISSQDWDGLIPGLNAHKFDAIMAGMSATAERKKVVDFSEPYFNNTLVLVAKKEANVGIADVNGKNVATQQATVSADYLKEHYPEAIVKAYDKQDNAYLDLGAGRVDFMLSDVVPMSDWLKTEAGQGFEVKGSPIDIGDTIAIATRKDDALVSRFNTALAELKSNGEYDKIVAKYFDSAALGINGNASTTTNGSEATSEAAQTTTQ